MTSKSTATITLDRPVAEGGHTVLKRTGYVLIVDDDPVICEVLLSYFAENNLRAMAAFGRLGLQRHLATAPPCIILLDLHVNRDDGLDLLREIRSYSDVPVIIMSGSRLAEMDRVIGLELGADDYVLKPFGPRELLARIKAVLRRQALGQLARSRSLDRGGYRFEGWQLQGRSRALTDPLGASVSLSKAEFALLVAFLNAPRRPLTREHLLQATRMHEDVFDRSIDVRVMRLRRKLEADPAAPKLILSERGVGYSFAATVKRYWTSNNSSH
jgi:two-component system, OmpR family, response regulator